MEIDNLSLEINKYAYENNICIPPQDNCASVECRSCMYQIYCTIKEEILEYIMVQSYNREEINLSFALEKACMLAKAGIAPELF